MIAEAFKFNMQRIENFNENDKLFTHLFASNYIHHLIKFQEYFTWTHELDKFKIYELDKN